MDTIYLRDIELVTVIGAYEWEQRIEQKLIVNVSMSLDCRAAGLSDALTDALDYGAVLAKVQAVAQQNKVALLERLATLMAEALLNDFSLIQSVTIDLAKVFIFPQVPRVGVVITRERSM